MDVQKIIVNNLENDIEHPVNLITGPNDVDLLFNDEDYNTLVEFSDGEIKTKNFNSKKLSLVVDEYQQIATGSFGVADPSNNRIVAATSQASTSGCIWIACNANAISLLT